MKVDNNNKNIIVIIISSILMVIFHNINIDWYIKDIIIPFSIAIITYIIILKNNSYTNKKAYYLLIPITLVLISDLIIKIDYSNKCLNVITLIILIAMFLFILTNKNYTISAGCLSWVFKLFPSKLFSNLKYLNFKTSKIKNKKIINVFFGVLIGGALGIVIIGLLMSADGYFGAFIGNITNVFNFNLGTSIINAILFLIAFIIMFSTLTNISLNKNTKIKDLSYKNPDEIMVITILSIVNVIFLLFLFSEISRLTTNFLNSPIKYTYSGYAREGFFQLLFVTIINFSIVMFLLNKTKIIKESKKVKNLVLLLISFSTILIFNSYYRMFLYIVNYGFTILRLQVILFLAMELILFIVLSIKIIRNLKYKDAIIYFVIIISFYIINLYLCSNSFIGLLN